MDGASGTIITIHKDGKNVFENIICEKDKISIIIPITNNLATRSIATLLINLIRKMNFFS